jgi:hypothetical protein
MNENSILSLSPVLLLMSSNSYSVVSPSFVIIISTVFFDVSGFFSASVLSIISLPLIAWDWIARVKLKFKRREVIM